MQQHTFTIRDKVEWPYTTTASPDAAALINKLATLPPGRYRIAEAPTDDSWLVARTPRYDLPLDLDSTVFSLDLDGVSDPYVLTVADLLDKWQPTLAYAAHLLDTGAGDLVRPRRGPKPTPPPSVDVDGVDVSEFVESVRPSIDRHYVVGSTLTTEAVDEHVTVFGKPIVTVDDDELSHHGDPPVFGPPEGIGARPLTPNHLDRANPGDRFLDTEGAVWEVSTVHHHTDRDTGKTDRTVTIMRVAGPTTVAGPSRITARRSDAVEAPSPPAGPPAPSTPPVPPGAPDPEAPRGAYGMTTLEQVHRNLELAENDGDVAECADALEALIPEYRLKTPVEADVVEPIEPCEACPWEQDGQPDITDEVRVAAQNGVGMFMCHTGQRSRCIGAARARLPVVAEPLDEAVAE